MLFLCVVGDERNEIKLGRQELLMDEGMHGVSVSIVTIL